MNGEAESAIIKNLQETLLLMNIYEATQKYSILQARSWLETGHLIYVFKSNP